MQGNLLDIFFILLLMLIDFYLQKKINKKGYEFLCINKGRLRYPILVNVDPVSRTLNKKVLKID